MSSNPFTCLACHVVFDNGDLQRNHYKSEWHRYNLQRKVAEMPPIAEARYNEILRQKEKEKEKTTGSTTGHCKVCNKHFNTQNAYANHVQSKKHKEIEAKQQQKLSAEEEKLRAKQAEKGLIPIDSVKLSEKNLKNASTKAPESSTKTSVPEEMDTDDESVESWSGDALGLEECLFCPMVSDDLEGSMAHMASAHSFFIPDLEFASDLEGLILYLGEKVGEGHVCLWCSSKSYASTKAVQQHMTDKGHCKMLFEGDALTEYADFYDYRKSYPDYVEGDEAMEEEELEEGVVEEENYSLVLPSGASIGHRSLQRYYNQNLRAERSSALTPVNKLMSQYRALGWTGSSGVVAQKRAKDIAFVKRERQKYQMRLSCKANKLVKHMRPQVVF